MRMCDYCCIYFTNSGVNMYDFIIYISKLSVITLKTAYEQKT